MTDRPILMNGEMVRAVLSGRKTQTRRLCTYWRGDGNRARKVLCEPTCPPVWPPPPGKSAVFATKPPYGVPGDRLWVRESWRAHLLDEVPTPKLAKYVICRYAADYSDLSGQKWRPSIHMPRWASRLTLEVTGVRVERLQDISEEDAKAEGVRSWFERFPETAPGAERGGMSREQTLTSGEVAVESPFRSGFALLWDEINDGRATWKSNPLVWVVGFKRVAQGNEADNG